MRRKQIQLKGIPSCLCIKMKLLNGLSVCFLYLILALEYISGNVKFTEEFYNDWIEKYRKLSGNERPPKLYKTWIQEASRLGVSVEPSTYKPIFEQVKYFKDKRITVEYIREQHRKVSALFPDRNDIALLNVSELMYSKRWRHWPRTSNFDMLQSVLDPNIDCLAITQHYDEGMVIPADDNQKRLILI